MLILLSGSLFAAGTWDVLDKSMAAWNVNGGAANNKAWTTSQNGSGITVKQETGYVNITKTGAAATNNYAFLIPPALTLSANTPYSIEIKARTNAIDKQAFPDSNTQFEAHQISARLNTQNMAVFLKHGDANNGYISLTGAATHKDEDKYKVNTSEWHIYRFVFFADNLRYDVYIDDIEEPIFEDVATTAMAGSNIIRLGAESSHRCNMDIEYVKMGTGDFYSKTKIISVALSSAKQGEGSAETITATAHTILINDNEKLLISLVDSEDNTVVSAVEAKVLQNKAEIQFTIPATVPKGKYYVKAAAPNGKIGDTDVSPRKTEYAVISPYFIGKNLATFGNSITAAANSWAYQVNEKLGFANLYNGAMSAAIWYKRERTVAGQTIHTQNYYDSDFAGISTVAPSGENVMEHQRRINNCAIVHLQKYFIELEAKRAPTPDVIIFSYGTNDEVINMGDAESALQGDDLSKVNIFTMAGALRWSLDTLKIKFPEAKIYVALPLQSTREGKNDDNLKKMEIIKRVCDAKSVPYFDCYNESGINVENHATYLSDRLHPNEAGKVVHGDYIAKKLEEAVSGPSSVTQQTTVQTESISISASVLNAGQPLQVKSLKDDISLSEVGFYGIAGNKIYCHSTPGNEYMFHAPTVAGMYVLTVRLNDNTTKGFKILVKN